MAIYHYLKLIEVYMHQRIRCELTKQQYFNIQGKYIFVRIQRQAFVNNEYLFPQWLEEEWENNTGKFLRYCSIQTCFICVVVVYHVTILTIGLGLSKKFLPLVICTYVWRCSRGPDRIYHIYQCSASQAAPAPAEHTLQFIYISAHHIMIRIREGKD